MVSRIHNRNNGNSEGLFPQNPNVENNNAFNSIEGATALKLDEKFEVNDNVDESLISNLEPNLTAQNNENLAEDTNLNSIPSGVSIENASYMENAPNLDNGETTSTNQGISTNLKSEVLNDEEYTPKLFEEENVDEAETRSDDTIDTYSDKLFDKDSNEEEEDFEIPAFLRKQKF